MQCCFCPRTCHFCPGNRAPAGPERRLGHRKTGAAQAQLYTSATSEEEQGGECWMGRCLQQHASLGSQDAKPSTHPLYYLAA